MSEWTIIANSPALVLDDGNTDDDDVAFCIKYAREHNDPEGGPQQRRVRLTDLRGRPQAHRRPCPQGHDVCEHGEDHDLRRFALRFSGLSEEEQAQLLA